MKISEKEHEILEQLWVTIEEEGQAGCQIQGPLPEEVEDLIKKGLAAAQDGLLKLTQSGSPEAAKAVRRHRLAERLLADVLITEEKLIDEQACHMEHALFDGLDDNICTLLGHPRFCPHGKPIPTGECCRNGQASVNRLIAPLGELQPGQHGHIAYIHFTNSNHLQKLMAMGVFPGVPVKLLRRFPSVVFEAGNSQFAVDEEIAAEVYVRISNEPKTSPPASR
jgi:DtxR family Mn-dependent transcriptional regulator